MEKPRRWRSKAYLEPVLEFNILAVFGEKCYERMSV
jgi:hypothetical protein